MRNKILLIGYILTVILCSIGYTTPPVYVVIDEPIRATTELEQGTLNRFMSSLAYNVGTKEVDTIVILIKSPGGDVWEAMAIYDYIQMLKPRYYVHTYAIGVCASAAMIILQAGDERWTTRNTMLMTHKPLYIAPEGMRITSTDAKDAVDSLAKCNEVMIALFARRMKVSKNSLRKYFTDKEHYSWGGMKMFNEGFVDHLVIDGWRWGVENK